MSMDTIELWLRAFLFTQLVEIPVYMKLLRVRWHVAFGASAITHPVVWFVIMGTSLFPSHAQFGIAELFALAAEAVYFAVVSRDRLLGRCVAASFVANAASVFCGEICRSLFGLP